MTIDVVLKLGVGVALLFSTIPFYVNTSGEVSVEWFVGRLSKHVNGPGLNFVLPIVGSYRKVKVIPDTDCVKNIPCGTKGGTMIFFDELCVVNQLHACGVYNVTYNYPNMDWDQEVIYRRVEKLVNAFCSTHTVKEINQERFHEIEPFAARC